MPKNRLHPEIVARMAEFGLVVKKGQNLKPAKLKLVDLKFRSFLLKDEDYITGKEMRKRAISRKGNLGLADAKNLLDQLNSHPDKRKNLQDKCIVLPRTLLRSSDGHHLCVAYLFFNGGCWCLIFDWLECGWGSRDLFACSE